MFAADTFVLFSCIGFIYHCLISSYITFAEPVASYTSTRICGQTVILGRNLFLALVEFSLPEKHSNLFVNFTCLFRIQTTPGSLIALKFTSPVAVSNRISDLNFKCRRRITISSAELNVKMCNSFPEKELSDYDYVDLKYEVREVQNTTYTSTYFKFLVFTFHYPDLSGKCHKNEILCNGTGRCVHRTLKCSNMFDFCGNNMKNCKNITNIETSKIRQTSFSGVYIFLSCLVFLLGVTCYMCFCQGVHLYECVCHCCSVLEKSGNEHVRPTTATSENNNLTEPEHRAEDIDEDIQPIDNDHNAEDEHNSGDTSDNVNISDNVSYTGSGESVTFGLPPSYSCITMRDQVDYIEMKFHNAAEPNKRSRSNGSIDLPPSYSTVLGHEDEYNVHV